MALMPDVADRFRRHRHGEVDVVDDDLGQNFRARLRGLDPAAGLADDRRHLRAGVAGRQHDLRQVGAQGDRLAEAGGRTAAERDDAIGPHVVHGLHRPFGHLDGRVHDRAGEHAGKALTDHLPDAGDQIFLPRGSQHQRAGHPEPGQFVRQLTQRAGAEHHAHRRALVHEVLHGRSLRTEWPAPQSGAGRFRVDTSPQEAGCATLRKPATCSRLPEGTPAGRRANRIIAPAAIADTPIDRNIGVGLW